MYEESGRFDPNVMMVHGTGATTGPSEDCFSQIASESDPPLEAVISGTATETHHSFAENVGLSVENLPSYPYSCGGSGGGEDAATITAATSTLTCRVAASVTTAMEITAAQHPQQMDFHMENPYNHFNNTNLVEEVNNSNHCSSQDLSFINWDTSNLERAYNSHHQNQQFPYPTTPTPGLLNLLHLPKSPASPYGNSSLSCENPTHTTTTTNLSSKPSGHATWIGNCPMGAESTNASSVSYDPSLHLNLQQQAPAAAALRELCTQPLPHAYTMPMPPSRSDFVFGEGDDMEGSGVAFDQDGDHGRDLGNGVLEFTQDVAYAGGKKRGGKRTKQGTNTTERQRRVDLGSKFDALKELIPNLTRNDRASVVGDAIEYVRELRRTVNELKLLAEKKRQERQRNTKRHKVEEGATEGDCNLELVAVGDPDEHSSYNESLRSSWIQRKSKDTEVDVRIVDDEVTIKLVQRKKINCLVHASQVLDELKLDLQHVAGGHIGDFCSFMFNSKICEGSSVYASAIANKLIEVMDRSLAAA